MSCYQQLREEKTGYHKRPEVRKIMNKSSRKWKDNNPEKVRKWAKEYYIKNKDKIKQRIKKYSKEYSQRPEVIKRKKELRHKRHIKNKDKENKQSRKWQRENKGKCKKSFKKWYDKNGKKYWREYQRKKLNIKPENYRMSHAHTNAL
jgi:hypothetical protein